MGYNVLLYASRYGVIPVSTINHRQKIVLRLIIINLTLLALALFWARMDVAPSVDVAVAKGKQMLDMNLASAPAIDSLAAEEIAIEGQELSAERADELEFINATLLTPGEARYWQSAGCGDGSCAHVTFYDHAEGGSREAVVDLENNELIASWGNEFARPAGSTWVLPHAMAVASEDPGVQAVLGDIGSADPAMVPMSGWLADSSCSQEWCVDLTFHDPNGSGKIFHVFVNMESDSVERTFYTRGREDRSAAEPLSQRAAFTDDCHEQYGWEVCWEMTAHDGIEFRDATYSRDLIFSSAKIAQVEAWYPSWPGGYRDEIGYSASVPPFGDTLVIDLENGFEVRQTFTEFTHWPNCICCYRYQQLIRFFDDGSLDFGFVSAGPGCDDLSIYRPFWRIDVDLNGAGNDEVWLWEDFAWQEQAIEFEEHPIVDELSPDGQKLATIDGDLNYRWSMVETDPLGRDEGYLFLLQFKPEEGTGPIVTGPGDTFIPPRQWIDSDELSGENIVLWHVPLLKTSKGDPWWCMPDPDPDFSPCEAILRAEPGEELIVLTDEELATMEAEQAAQEEEASSQPLPEPISTPSPQPTARPIEGTEPEEIMLNAGCTSCHQIGALGESHKVGPDLSDIGWAAQGRVEGMTADAYILQSIIDPNVYLAPECPNGPCLANVMPRDYGQRLSSDQQALLVTFLMEQQTPSAPADAGAATASGTVATKAVPAAKTVPPGSGTRNVTAVRLASILLLTLVFLVSLLIFLRGGPKGSDKES
jgi:hypothetical protein